MVSSFHHRDYVIEGLRCAACAVRLERVLNRLPAVRAQVNFATAQAEICTDKLEDMPDEKTVMQVVEKAGFQACPLVERDSDALEQQYQTQWQGVRTDFILSLVCTVPLMMMMLLNIQFFFPHWVMLFLAAFVQIWCGRSFYYHAWHALRSGGATMDVLVALGTTTAFGYSVIVMLLGLHEPVYLDSSVMVITMVLLGRLLEMRMRHQAGIGLQRLLKNQPQMVHLEKEGVVTECPVTQLYGGETLIVRPGEAIPVDGVVVDGVSEVDESALSGESVPVLRQKGDKVLAATINRYAVLRVQVVATGRQTVFARIMRFVEQAQASRVPAQRLADRVSAVFVPVIIVCSVLSFVLTWLWVGSFSTALIRAVSVLVVACPCALGLATPVAVMVGTARGAERGVFFRNVSALECVQRVTAFVFDKTGTLTLGCPVLTASCPVAPYDDDFLRALALMMERDSEHPLAQAVRDAVAESSVLPFSLRHMEAVPGKGIMAQLDNGSWACLGTAAFLQERGLSFSPSWIEAQEVQGRSAVAVALEEKIVGFLAFEDQLRPEAPDVLRWVREQGILPVMITGDNVRVAHAVAARLGIEVVKSHILPEQKAAEIEALRQEGHFVGMVGDGINDAPALAVADVSIAMGSGAAMALETADIVLMQGGLRQLIESFSLSQVTLRCIYQNLFFAFIYNILSVPFAVLGFLTPTLASAMMATSSVSVMGNALLLRWWRVSRFS